MNPWLCNEDPKLESTVMGWNQYSQNRVGSTSGIGPSRYVNISATAGGDFHVPGDYMYRTREGFMFGGGLWGIFRVGEENGWDAAPPGTYCKQ